MIDRPRRHATLRPALGLACAALAVACTPKVYDDPVGRMQDRGESTHIRLAAARQAERDLPDDPDRLRALKRITWERRYPEPLRAFAIDSLIRHDEADAKAHFRHALVLMHNWPTMKHLLDRAVELNWVDFTPAIVRNYARPAWAYADGKRPERDALKSLHPGEPVERVVFGVFTDAGHADVRERVAAWQLLGRLVEDRAELRRMLDGAAANDPLVLDLQAAANELHVFPVHRETITWLQALRAGAHAGLWADATRATARLTDAQRAGLEMRHVPLLAHLARRDDARLAATRDALLADVGAFIAAQDHHHKAAGYGVAGAGRPQHLHAAADALSWGDLLVMSVLIDAMREPRIVGAWFDQADADHRDTSTEYGGLMTWADDGALTARLYKPMARMHDRKYLPPEQLTLDSYTALAHYHFHAQQHHHADYAGPGRGDLDRVADDQRYNGLLLTFINENTLNLDFYRHGKLVVDLGDVSRPTP